MPEPKTRSSSPVLDYAPPPRFVFTRRWILGLLIALVTLGLLLYLGGEAWYKIPYWRWLYQRHAAFQPILTYTDAPTHAVYEDLPALPQGSHCAYPTDVGKLVMPWNRDKETILFLHRRSSGGHDRLVLVSFSFQNLEVYDEGLAGRSVTAFRYWGEFSTEVFDASLVEGNVHRAAPRQTTIFDQTIKLPASRTFRLFAGQSDPADTASFTIDYELDGKRSTIRGTLDRDGKRVSLTSLP